MRDIGQKFDINNYKTMRWSKGFSPFMLTN